jgi:chromate transport protein ChrA
VGEGGYPLSQCGEKEFALEFGMTDKANLQRSRLPELFAFFLQLGLTAFGGPAAHIALMEQGAVSRQWMSREEFLDLVGGCNLLPGPSSTQVAMALGYRRGRVSGLVIAGLCFILPASLATLALAWAYVHFGRLPQVAGFLYGTKPVIVAIVAQAILRLGWSAVKRWTLAFLGVACLVAAAGGLPPFVILLWSGVHRAVVSETRRGRLRFRVRASGIFEGRFGGSAPLDQCSAVARCGDRRTDDTGAGIRYLHVHWILAARMGWRRRGDNRGVSAFVFSGGNGRSARGTDSPIKDGRRVHRWSERRGSCADGPNRFCAWPGEPDRRACVDHRGYERCAVAVAARKRDVADPRRRCLGNSVTGSPLMRSAATQSYSIANTAYTVASRLTWCGSIARGSGAALADFIAIICIGLGNDGADIWLLT